MKNICKVYQRSEFTNLKWNDSSKDVFRRRNTETLPQLNSVTVNVDTSSRASVNDSINKFVAIVKEAADPLFLIHYFTQKTARCRSTTSKPAVWYNLECKELKQKYKISLGQFNRNRTDENSAEMYDISQNIRSW